MNIILCLIIAALMMVLGIEHDPGHISETESESEAKAS